MLSRSTVSSLVLAAAACVVLAACSHSTGSAQSPAQPAADAPKTTSAADQDGPQVNAAGFKELKAHDFDVQWKVDGDKLDVIESYPTTGWIGWGIGTTGQMKGSTIIIGYVKDNALTVSDTFGNALNHHTAVTDLGGTSKLTDTSGSLQNGVTTMKFSLPLDAGDADHVKLVPGQAYKMLLAHADNGVDDLTSYHGPGNRFVVDITL